MKSVVRLLLSSLKNQHVFFGEDRTFYLPPSLSVHSDGCCGTCVSEFVHLDQ